jgi:hypothetical protein
MPEMQVQRGDIDGYPARPSPGHDEPTAAIAEQFATAFTPGEVPVDAPMPEIRLPS